MNSDDRILHLESDTPFSELPTNPDIRLEEIVSSRRAAAASVFKNRGERTGFAHAAFVEPVTATPHPVLATLPTNEYSRTHKAVALLRQAYESVPQAVTLISQLRRMFPEEGQGDKLVDEFYRRMGVPEHHLQRCRNLLLQMPTTPEQAEFAMRLQMLHPVLCTDKDSMTLHLPGGRTRMIVGMLGKGGMGAVYLCIDPAAKNDEDRVRAIKIASDMPEETVVDSFSPAPKPSPTVPAHPGQTRPRRWRDTGGQRPGHRSEVAAENDPHEEIFQTSVEIGDLKYEGGTGYDRSKRFFAGEIEDKSRPGRYRTIEMPLLDYPLLEDSIVPSSEHGIRVNKGLNWAQSYQVGHNLLQHLSGLHRRGFTHLDLKPGNVFLTPTGAGIHFIDYGLARRQAPIQPDARQMQAQAEESAPRSLWGRLKKWWNTEADLTGKERTFIGVLKKTRGAVQLPDAPKQRQPSATQKMIGTGDPEMIMGSLDYMSPEQAAGMDTHPASDQYAAGVMLYEMMTGARPIEGQTMLDTLLNKRTGTPDYQALFDAIGSKLIDAAGDTLPASGPLHEELLEEMGTAAERLTEVIKRMLSRERKDRFTDAASALQAWDAAIPKQLKNASFEDPEILYASIREKAAS